MPNATVPSIFPGGIPTTNASLANIGSPNYPNAIHNAAGQVVAFAPDGSLQPVNLGIQNNGLVFGSGGDGDNLAGQSSFIAPIDRILFDSLAHYDVTDHVRLYLETEFAHSNATQLAAQPSYQSAFFARQKGAAPIQFTTANPFLNPQAAATLNAAGASTFYLSRANLDLAPQTVNNRITTYRFVGGLKGDFTLAERKFNWDTSFNYGRTEAKQTYYDINEENFLNAINVVRNPGTGQIQCAVTVTPPPAPAAGGGQPFSVTGCQPLNLFGAGAPSAAARAFVTAQDQATSILTQKDAQFNINTVPFHYWAGDVKIALGYEYREESGSYNVDPFALAGLGRAAPSSNVGGGYNSKEFSAEFHLPLVSPEMGWRYLHSFGIDGSFRRISNSLAGSANVYTLGGTLAPARDIEFRGNYTRSVRAPSIEELFLPVTNTQSFAQDPCDPNYISAKAVRRQLRGGVQRARRAVIHVQVLDRQRVGDRHHRRQPAFAQRNSGRVDSGRSFAPALRARPRDRGGLDQHPARQPDHQPKPHASDERLLRYNELPEQLLQPVSAQRPRPGRRLQHTARQRGRAGVPGTAG